MENQLKSQIEYAIATGRPVFHEAAPDDFGPESNRRAFLRDCLAQLLRRYPALHVTLIGDPNALARFSLRPGLLPDPALHYRVRVAIGQTTRRGAVRLVFSRPPALRAVPPPEGFTNRTA